MKEQHIESSAASPGWLRRCLNGAVNLLLPGRCACCGLELPGFPQGPPLLCEPCLTAIETFEGKPCPRCANPMPVAAWSEKGCPRCRLRRVHFSAATTLGIFHGELREAILRTKNPAGEMLTMALARRLGERLRATLPAPPDLVVPVPMHWLRRWTRRCNSVGLLADIVAGYLQVPRVPRLLRARRSRKQGTLTVPQRWKNVRGVYRVKADPRLEGARVLVVDDVMTTGAT